MRARTWRSTRAAVDRDGRILALEIEIAEDFGAYCFYPANYLARVVAMILTGPYAIQDYAFDVKIALTNKCGSGPMRAPMAITSWVMEGTIDAIARRLGARSGRRSTAQHGAGVRFPMPCRPDLSSRTSRRYETLERALREIDSRAFAHASGGPARGLYRGLGICCVVEIDHLRLGLLQGRRHSRFGP